MYMIDYVILRKALNVRRTGAWSSFWEEIQTSQAIEYDDSKQMKNSVQAVCFDSL